MTASRSSTAEIANALIAIGRGLQFDGTGHDHFHRDTVAGTSTPAVALDSNASEKGEFNP